MKKNEIDLKFIQENMTQEDFRDVVNASGKFTANYVYMVAREDRKNEDVIKLLHKNITIRLAQRVKRIEKLKSYNFNNPKN